MSDLVGTKSKLSKMCSHTIDEFFPLGKQMTNLCDKFCISTSYVMRDFPLKQNRIFAYITYTNDGVSVHGEKVQRKLLVCAMDSKHDAGYYLEGEGQAKPVSFSSDIEVYVWSPSEINLAQQIWLNATIKAVSPMIPSIRDLKKDQAFTLLGISKYHLEMAQSLWTRVTEAHAGFLFQNVNLIYFLVHNMHLHPTSPQMLPTTFQNLNVADLPEPELVSNPLPESATGEKAHVPDFSKQMSEFNLAFQQKYKYNPIFRYGLQDGQFLAQLTVGTKTFSHLGASKSLAAGWLVNKYQKDIL